MNSMRPVGAMRLLENTNPVAGASCQADSEPDRRHTNRFVNDSIVVYLQAETEIV